MLRDKLKVFVTRLFFFAALTQPCGLREKKKYQYLFFSLTFIVGKGKYQRLKNEKNLTEVNVFYCLIYLVVHVQRLTRVTKSQNQIET